jgi:tRNA dimethylallyltransferase
MNYNTKEACCLFLLGPTASGKTALSLELADWLDADIISADSRQIFRYMNIGTASPKKTELARVKHYFINEKDPDETFSAGEFGIEARKIIDEKISQAKNIIVCGGSGLYIEAIRGMIADTPTTNNEIRNSILDRAKTIGWEKLYEELKQIDSEYAENIDAQNPKRICRGLEIWESTGKKPSLAIQGQNKELPWPSLAIGLDPERSILYDRINRRVLNMVEEGLIEEVRALIDLGYSPELNALNTVGYKEVIAFLDGKLDKEKAIDEIQKNTRHFAKRQMTWFKKYAPDHWITYKQEPNLHDIVEKAQKLIVACQAVST